MQGNEYSVLEYVLANQKASSMIEKLVIDEDRFFAMHWVNQDSKTIFSDHNTMILEMNIDTRPVKSESVIKIKKRGYELLKTYLEQSEITELFYERDAFQQEYDTWTQIIEENIHRVKVTKFRKNKRKDERLLLNIIKSLRQKLKERT